MSIKTTTTSQQRTIHYFRTCLQDGYAADFARQDDDRVKVTVFKADGTQADVFAIDQRGFTVRI